MMKKTLILMIFFLPFLSLEAFSGTLNTGPWRFELKTTHATIPFILDIKKKKTKYEGSLHNGKELIRLTGIQVNGNAISIPLQTYELSLELELLKKGLLSGSLVRHNKNPKVKTPIQGTFGTSERFLGNKKQPTIDLNGRWAITLLDEQDHKERGVLLFDQKENSLNGSILTPTGDYRYFEGFVSGNEFEAASFDGVYNYLLKGNLENGKLKANILSNYKTIIEGVKDESAELPDAYKQTQLDSLNFNFPDLKGNNVNLDSPQFKNKPIIVQFFGSWCPNCLDEMNYLIPWYKSRKHKSVEIIALAFERSNTKEEAKKQLFKTQKKYQIPYTLLIAGSTSEDKPKDKIPGLKNFISFPTTIFLNKKHQIIKIHAGFTGPSTGVFFEKWKKEFNQTVDELVK
jgi:thiol-disulfide isomerase/thioredoxin